MATTLLYRLTLYEILHDIESYYKFSVNILAVIGALYATKFTISFTWNAVTWFRQYILTRIWYEKDFPKRYGGNWAIITGASDGIGKAYAFELARRKMNVFLISRSETKLQAVAEEIEEKYKVKASFYPLDLCKLREDDVYRKLEKELLHYDITLLVNNVGMATKLLEPFLNADKQTLLNMTDLNMTTTVLMTYMVLPRLIAKENGAIINISSLVSLNPTPLMNVYSSTKIFIDYFTESLWYEYKNQGVTIQYVSPGYTSTNLTNNPKPNFLLVINPLNYADSALRTLGITRHNYGWLPHHLAACVGMLMPHRVFMFSAFYVHSIIWQILTGRKKNY